MEKYKNKPSYEYDKEIPLTYIFKTEKDAREFILIMENSKYFQFTSGFIAKVEGNIINKYKVVVFMTESIKNYKKNEETINMIDEVIKEIISPDMTEKEALKSINQFLVDYTEYDVVYTNVYDLLKYGRGRCTAYALSFKVLAEWIGIRTDVIVGNVGGADVNHAWNKVYLSDGIYYNDSTFNDHEVQNEYFLLSEEDFMYDRVEFFAINRFPFFAS
jgi:transglutaminase/protease-like cytokinesis protein 3